MNAREMIAEVADTIPDGSPVIVAWFDLNADRVQYAVIGATQN